MPAWENILENLRKFAEKNQHLLGLTRTAIGVTLFIFTLIGAIIAYLVPVVGSTVWSMITGILQKARSLVELAAALIAEHQELVLLMAVAVIVLFVRLRRLNWRLSSLEILLDKSVSANLANWDYHGQWSSDGQVLDVTNSDDGGLSKWGAGWENYDFNFSFKIVSQCAAWIVRAQDHHHYVMMQCNQSQIRPHVRTAAAPNDPERGFRVISELSHGLSMAEWNAVRTEVRGYGIRVFINERMVFYSSDLLSDFPLGRAGFRCSGAERASFKNVVVVQKAGYSMQG